ncbi:MAG: alpha-ketoglutarate-dependent dioxygenase AlkB [Flavobacteriaceae bacterium]|nr:MAG: alpha-ketoglutarate-dependent dioxygenase AlkB [Flavobacteriaceae bacterium]
MDLFSTEQYPNLLPIDGEVRYYGPVMSYEESEKQYRLLLDSIAWEHDQALVFGKLITTKRKIAWYGDSDFSYTYSKITKTALPWTPGLLVLKQLVETRLKTTFNSCLINLYHNGSEGMAWHSDAEKTLGDTPIIASLSFGAERKFALKHKETKQTVSLVLEKGSLLLMAGTCQQYWLHRLPPTKKGCKPRINLTFRNIVLEE